MLDFKAEVYIKFRKINLMEPTVIEWPKETQRKGDPAISNPSLLSF